MSITDHCNEELMKIAEEQKKRGFLRNAALVGGGIAAVAGGAYGAVRGGRALKGAVHRQVNTMADTLAERIGAGIRSGVRTGFQEGVQDLEKRAPDMAATVADRLEPRIQTIVDESIAKARTQVDDAMNAAAERARAEAPELGKGISHGFSENVRKKLPRLFGGS